MRNWRRSKESQPSEKIQILKLPTKCDPYYTYSYQIFIEKNILSMNIRLKTNIINKNIIIPEVGLLKLCLDTLQLHPNDKWGGIHHVLVHLVILQAVCIEK